MSTYDTTTVEGTDTRPRERVSVAGGVLVYAVDTEYHEVTDTETRVGRELVGVERVTSRAELADALAARGHDRGGAYHLPELDE